MEKPRLQSLSVVLLQRADVKSKWFPLTKIYIVPFDDVVYFTASMRVSANADTVCDDERIENAHLQNKASTVSASVLQ